MASPDHSRNVRRAVVTGIGAVAAPGGGVDDLWKGLQAEPGPAPRLVAGLHPGRWLPTKVARRLDRSTQTALVAAHEAVETAGGIVVDPTRVAVAVATGVGGLAALEELVHQTDAEAARASP